MLYCYGPVVLEIDDSTYLCSMFLPRYTHSLSAHMIPAIISYIYGPCRKSCYCSLHMHSWPTNPCKISGERRDNNALALGQLYFCTSSQYTRIDLKILIFHLYSIMKPIYILLNSVFTISTTYLSLEPQQSDRRIQYRERSSHLTYNIYS